MKTYTTPGIDFLVRNLVLPASFNYAALRLALHYLEAQDTVPNWLLGSLSVLLVPARVIAGEVWKYQKHKRQAAALGARLPPVIDSKSFANLKLLGELTESWKHQYPGDIFWDFVKDFGRVWNFRILFFDSVFTIEPEYIKRVLATEFDNFEKGERFQYAMSAVLGSGVFNSDGEMWKFHRSMARPFFARDRVTDIERFDKHISTGITLFKERMKTGYAIDFQDLVQRIVMDMASEFLLGTSVNSLAMSASDLPQPFNHPSHHESIAAQPNFPANAFSQAFLNAQMVAAHRDRLGWVWPLLEIMEDKSKPHMKVVDGFLVPIIKEIIKKNEHIRVGADGQREKREVGDDESLLDHLACQTSDVNVLKDQALNILLAGRDTVSATITFIFYLLAKYPHVQRRLNEEILEKVGPTRRPTFDDLREMKYLRAVINETLRILPAVPWDVRECINGALWPPADPKDKPIYVPPGATVSYGVLLMHTFEELWGPDAAEFDPDRFLDERNKKYFLANPFIFLPFNAGPRICLGQQLAYNEISLTTIRLLQAFSSFTMDADAVPPEARVPADWAGGYGRKGMEGFRPKVVLTMSCEGGMWLKAEPIEHD